MAKTVLFVDDSPTMRRIIRNTLTKLGYDDLVEAENGQDAIEKMAGRDIHFILTDWNMPELNGEEFVKFVRNDANYKDIPILMITTRGMKDDVIKAVSLGVNGYVVKPFTVEILDKKIKNILT
ncbi:MAG: response regulator [Candidatus Marinimicrobia bacterium]|nr:response regulator [Candidatus Neomarinimicrobiota bacterium]